MDHTKLSQILDSLTDGVYMLDTEGRYLYVNNALVQLSDLTRKEFLTMSIYDVQKKGMLSNNTMLTTTLQEKNIHSRRQKTYNNEYPNGIDILTTQFPIFGEDGNVKYVVGLCQNINAILETYHSATEDGATVLFDTRTDATPALIAEDPYSREMMKSTLQIARSDAFVLLTGESGAGKEVWADFIHNNSKRAGKPIVKINCAALSESLLEAELFGYAPGAFTGASKGGKTGLIEEANGSTLFLDEINSMSMALQSKLLRVLENRKVRKIGAVKESYVDFRLICATNEDLSSLVETKQFRQDLYYRCNVIPLYVPPLRERRGDIAPLCRLFLAQNNRKYDMKKVFSEDVYQKLSCLDWPGNVRELRNFVERLMLLTDSSIDIIYEIPISLLNGGSPRRRGPAPAEEPPAAAQVYTMEEPPGGTSLKEYRLQFEKWLIEQKIQEYGSISQAAKHLDIDRTTLLRIRRR